MLVLTRRPDEAIVMGDGIVVTILAVEGDRVKIGIKAPPHVTVLRQELCDAVREQNLAAARFAAQPEAAPPAETLETVRNLLTDINQQAHS